MAEREGMAYEPDLRNPSVLRVKFITFHRSLIGGSCVTIRVLDQ